MIENLFIIYFAQAYGEGLYSSDVYQSTGTTPSGQTETNGQTVQDATAPSTGFINSSGPDILVPVILGASIVVAVVVTVVRKQLRKSRNQ